MTGKFCQPEAGSLPPVPGVTLLDKPPVAGYNYNSTLLTATGVNPASTWPAAVSGASFVFPVNAVITGLWLASSIINPDPVATGIFVGRVNSATATLNLTQASSIFFSHVSISANTISRTGGMSFGERSGLLLNAGERFGVYVSGAAANVRLTYALTIIWITATV